MAMGRHFRHFSKQENKAGHFSLVPLMDCEGAGVDFYNLCGFTTPWRMDWKLMHSLTQDKPRGSKQFQGILKLIEGSAAAKEPPTFAFLPSVM